MLEADMRTAVLDLVRYWQRPDHAACINASQQWHAANRGRVLTSAIVPLHTDDDGDDDGAEGGGQVGGAA